MFLPNLKTTESNLSLLEVLIKQVVSKVLPQIPHLHILLATTANKASNWPGNEGRGAAGPISLCSQLNTEHSKPNCCLETQISGN